MSICRRWWVSGLKLRKPKKKKERRVIRYSTGHRTKTRKAGSGWISYLRKGAFYKLECNDYPISSFPENLSLSL